MGQVFVSYSRKDIKRVRPIVRALENAGLSVWWDSNLEGGTQFSAEIEQAIDNSRAVVVFWSASSVKSTWVLDEAGRGRDAGKLVPASLDGTAPPIGFGQLHAIDLRRKLGSGRNPLDALVEAVAKKLEVEVPGGKASRSFMAGLPMSPFTVAAALVSLVAVAGLLVWLLGRGSGAGEQGLVSLRPFEAGGSSIEIAKSVTDAVERTFANNQIQTVVGKSDRADADFEVRGRISQAAGKVIADTDVLDPKSGRTLWSIRQERASGNPADLADQVALKIADVLSCSVYSLRRMAADDSAELYSRILRYCEAERSSGSQYGELPKLAKALTEVAPDSAQAWAYYANALSFNRTDETSEFRSAADRALALNPDNGAVRWGLATVPDPKLSLAARIDLLREGLALDPEMIWIKNNLGNLHRLAGQEREALRYWQEFVADYPLDHHQRTTLASLFAESGDITAARRIFAEIDRVRPDYRNVKFHALRSEALYGDPDRARKWATMLDLVPSDIKCMELAIAIRRSGARPTVDEIERDCMASRTFVAEQLLILAGHSDRAFAILEKSLPQFNDQPRFGPTFVYERGYESIRRDPRLIALLSRIGVPQYWLETGNFADFCSKERIPYDCRVEARKAVSERKSVVRS